MNWLYSVILRVLHALGLHEGVLFGEVDVVGCGSLTINTGRNRRLISIELDSNDCVVLPPCGGGVPDLVQGEMIRSRHGKNTLLVKWDVQRPRHIVWAVARR